MKIIRTVQGNILPEQLGATLVHEHTVFDEKRMLHGLLRSIPGMVSGAKAYNRGQDIRNETRRRKAEGIFLSPNNMGQVFQAFGEPPCPAGKLPLTQYCCNELVALRNAGGMALCDCSPILRPSESELCALSQKSGVHILSCVGFYMHSFIPKSLRQGGMQAMYQDLEKRLQDNPHTGFLKCAVSTLARDGRLISSELSAVKACAEMAKKTGLSLHIHTAFPVRKPHILELADSIKNQIGLAPQRVVFCHMDSYASGRSNPAAHVNTEGYDSSLACTLAQQGFYIGLDTWCSDGSFESPGFEIKMRTSLLLELIRKNYGDAIVLGHDTISRKAGTQNGGSGYTLVLRYLNYLENAGVLSQYDRQRLLVSNPAKLLSVDCEEGCET